jgi:hypothetical protein
VSAQSISFGTGSIIKFFASSQRQEGCVIVNKTNSELFFTITYFDDFVGVDAMSSREVPVYENEVSFKIWGRHSPIIKTPLMF